MYLVPITGWFIFGWLSYCDPVELHPYHLATDVMLPHLVGWRNAPGMFTAIPRHRIIPRYIQDIKRRMTGDISRRGVKAVAIVRKVVFVVVFFVLVSVEAGVLRQQALDGGRQEEGGTGVHTVPAIGESFSAHHLQEQIF